MKLLPLLGLLLVGGLAVSCKRGDPTPAELVTARQQSDRAKDDAYQWYVKNTVGAYERIGKHDPQWDGDVKVAFNLIASAGANRPDVPADWRQEIASLMKSAVDKGCADPYVRYAALRYGIVHLEKVSPSEAGALSEIVQSLADSDYPPRLKLYAALRTAETMRAALPAPDQQTQSQLFNIHAMIQSSLNQLFDAFQDRTTPPQELYEMCTDVLTLVDSDDQIPPGYWERIEGALRETRPKSDLVALLTGWSEIKAAWNARGGGYANQVTAEGGRLFEEHLKLAEKALQSAWDRDSNDPQPATLMLEVCTGLGKERPEMERWFQRAMLAAPNNHAACTGKLRYLEPMWFGSPEAMLAFGHECVGNTNWSGTVPLVLVDAHDFFASFQETEAARSMYWRRPGVWPDIRAAFEEFFRRSPDDGIRRQTYVRFAYKCAAWDDLNAQLRLLGRVNYDEFGGQEAFAKMLADAREHAKP